MSSPTPSLSRRRWLTAALCTVPLGCVGYATRKIAQDPQALNTVIEGAMIEAPQLGHMRLTTGFYLAIHQVVCGEPDLNADEQAFARMVINHFMGESFGHTVTARLKDQDLLYGEGDITFTGYYHSNGQKDKGALIDSMGAFTLFLPDGDRVETLTFSMRSLNQVKVLAPGDVPQRFEVIPARSSYEAENLTTRRWKDTAFQLQALLRDEATRKTSTVDDFAAYLATRGPLGPIMTIQYALHGLPDGTYSYSLKDRYPVYLHLPSALISAQPEYQRALASLAQRGPDRVRRVGNAVEVQLGYAAAIPYSTGHTERLVAPEMIEFRKRFRVPAFAAPGLEGAAGDGR
ncbi:MAG: hypothetical protein HY718_07150 [Planctomycetes bacterium]|nr:hypothetical protein [Planctomycetota bacterium]